MDYRQVEAFVKVVELAGFSRAAEEMHVSQPSISNYITTLEKELNTILINRSTKPLTTTFAGESFFDKAKEMLLLKQETFEMLRNLSDDVSGDLRILASSVPALYILPKIMAEFHMEYPGVSYTMKQADTAEVVQGISAYKADIGFAGSIISNQKCEYTAIADEELVFIAPKSETCFGEKEYSLDELLYSNSFISRGPGSGTRMQYEKYFVDNGIYLDKVRTCAAMDSTHSILSAVKSGLGVSIVSRIAAVEMLESGTVQLIKLKEPLPMRKIYAVLNKKITHSHLVGLFMDYVKTFEGADQIKIARNI